jgi:hypothetical protein
VVAQEQVSYERCIIKMPKERRKRGRSTYFGVGFCVGVPSTGFAVGFFVGGLGVGGSVARKSHGVCVCGQEI